MLVRSVIRSSGQLWKLLAGFVALLVGGGALVTGIATGSVVLILAGVLGGLLSLGATCSAIRCPECGDRWVWRAVSTVDAQTWVPWLFELAACPGCGAKLCGDSV